MCKSYSMDSLLLSKSHNKFIFKHGMTVITVCVGQYRRSVYTDGVIKCIFIVCAAIKKISAPLFLQKNDRILQNNKK